MNNYIKLLKYLDKTSNYDLATEISKIILKNAQQQENALTNVLKWKYLNRELKQKFKNMRELLATEVDVLGQEATKAVYQMGYWIKYVDDIQADPIDENPNRTEYNDETINSGTKWWQTFMSVIQPVENKIYSSHDLEDSFKNTYNQVKRDITNILNNINNVTPSARTEFAEYFSAKSKKPVGT